MLYIKFTKDYLEYFEEKVIFPDFLKKIIFAYKKIFGKITKITKDKGEVWLIPENNSKFKKSVIKNLKIYHAKTVVLSKKIDNFKEDLKNNGIKILDGKWLYHYLIVDVAKYICNSKNENFAGQNISFAVKNPQELDFEILKNLAQNCKNINLITKDDYKFKKLEQNLYKENGIILNVSYNYKRSFLKSDIVINIDLDEKEFNKFALPRKSIVINLEDIKIYNKGFNGINVLNYEIDLPKKYLDNTFGIDDFNKEILYESYIYKKTAPQNILKEIKQDNVKVTQLLGKNGYINKKEYLKV